MQKRSTVYRAFVFLILSVFLFNNISYGSNFSKHTLAAPSLAFEGEKHTPPNSIVKNDIANFKKDSRFLALTLFIAWKAIYTQGDMKQELKNNLKERFLKKDKMPEKAQIEFFKPFELLLKKYAIDVNDIKAEKGEIQIPFKTKNSSSQFEHMRLRIRKIDSERKDQEWYQAEKYEFKFEKDSAPRTHERDLKGFSAPSTKPIIEKLIGERQLIEIHLDEGAGELKANKVMWVDNYIPLLTPVELFLGEDINLEEIYTKPERETLINYMKTHRVMGKPVKFRITQGSSALEKKEDMEHANIAYASIFAGTINMGSLLLKHLLKKENEFLRYEILDNHEFRNLKGANFISRDDYEKRLQLVQPIIENIEELDRAMSKRDVYFLLDELKKLLKENDESAILEMFSVLNHIVLKYRKYPIQARFPIRHAVCLLEREEQNKLIRILQSKKSVEEGYRDLILIDDILLLFEDEVEIDLEWLKKHAKGIEDTSFWMISPEIWHEAGGLARVLQYDSTAILDLIKGSNVRFRTMEPWYQYRIGPDGKPKELDYRNPEHITHPIQGEIEIVNGFKVKVGDKIVRAVVGRGINDLGVETFMIKDEQDNRKSYYTHSLYNYRNFWEQNPDIGTWEDFAVFYSKAVKTFIEKYTAQEKEKLKRENKKWGGLVLYTNDSQTALIPFYWRLKLVEEFEKKRQDPDYKIDPIVLEALNIFKTHTYGNRKEYTLAEGVGDNTLNFMEVPRKWRELAKHLNNKGEAEYDVASLGLASSNGQRAVSAAHEEDIRSWDSWRNMPDGEFLKWLFKEFMVEIDTISEANADYRLLTAEVFRRIMRELYGQEMDIEHPTLEQVKQTKIKAKEEFSIKHLTYYSTHDKPSDGKVLNSDQIVISYSGRLVPKKVSKERSFYEGNIEELIKLGAQVVIYGNQQTNNTQSDELAEYFEHLTEKFKHKNYSGKLIFVPRFSLKDERWLKAVSDVGVHDSEPKSEAAGFTESNDAVCGGIVVAPLRTDNRFGEGLFTVQGIEMDRDVPGKGNTATPKTMTAEGYMEVFRMLLDKYSKDELKYYQATSIRLSRALGARSKVAEELRQISYDMSRKKAKDKARETMEEIRKMEHETKSLWGQLVVPSKEDEPKKHFVYYVSKRILDGKTDNAIRLLFTSEEFQNKKGNLDVLAEILNNLLEVFEKEPSAQENILNFTKSLIEGIVEFSGNDEESIEVAKAVQIMAGLVWIMPRGMRFTTNEKDMVQNERGKSYINARKLPEGIIEVKEETKPGLYWRHIEGVAKIKPVNIMKFAIHNKRQFENASKKIVNYIMLHGGKIISKDVMKEIESGNLSNPHETLFVNGLLRGSFQPASTGPGHLQIKMVNGKRKGVVDLKKINKGSYLQVNVRYDKSGNMRQVICQLAKQGEICFAIPGWRDYMIDLEGYGFEGFSDFSFVVSEEEAQLFDSSYRESDLEEIEKALKNKGEEDCAPYGALISKKGPLFIKANREVPEAVWIDSKAKDFTKIAFDTIYKNMSLEEKSRRCINALAQFCKSAKRDMQPLWYPDEAEGYLKKNFPTEFEPAPIFSLGMTKGIDSFISDTSECLASSGVAKQKTDKLIRIDVETLKKIKSEEVKEFLKTIQKTEHYNIRLYSSKNPELEINENEYKDFDIKKEPLPREFEMSRANTITLLMVDKGEEFPSSSHNVKWDRLGFSRKKDKNPLLSTIILPVGANYDHTGLARSIFFGLILSEIAANDELGKDSNFVAASLARFMKLYLAQGEDAKSFNLNCEDIVNLARGDVDALVASLNKLIKVLPIMPVNVNEQVEIYERAKEAWIRA